MKIDEHRHIGICGSRADVSIQDVLDDLDLANVDKAVLAPGGWPEEKLSSFTDEVKATEEIFSSVEKYFETGEVDKITEAMWIGLSCNCTPAMFGIQ